MFLYIFFKHTWFWLTLPTPLPILIPINSFSVASHRTPIVHLYFHVTFILLLPLLSYSHFCMLCWQITLNLLGIIYFEKKKLSRIWFCFCVSLSSQFLSSLLRIHSWRSVPVLTTLTILKGWIGKECFQKYSSGK